MTENKERFKEFLNKLNNAIDNDDPKAFIDIMKTPFDDEETMYFEEVLENEEKIELILKQLVHQNKVNILTGLKEEDYLTGIDLDMSFTKYQEVRLITRTQASDTFSLEDFSVEEDKVVADPSKLEEMDWAPQEDEPLDEYYPQQIDLDKDVDDENNLPRVIMKQENCSGNDYNETWNIVS